MRVRFFQFDLTSQGRIGGNILEGILRGFDGAFYHIEHEGRIHLRRLRDIVAEYRRKLPTEPYGE